MNIALIDYGAGNLTSVVKGFAAVTAAVRIVSEPDELVDADALVIPGVGHFQATAALDEDWRRIIRDLIDAGTPVLGICLGLQWLFEGSDEAPDLPGLGVFAGRCFRLEGQVKVPHVGWNTLDPTGRPSRLLDGIPPRASAYFTHSYAAPVSDATVAQTTHGITFAATVERDRVFGTQFHPEKSGPAGLHHLRNFVAAASGKR